MTWNLEAFDSIFKESDKRQKQLEADLEATMPSAISKLDAMTHNQLLDQFKHALGNTSCYHLKERQLWQKYADAVEAVIIKRMEQR